MDPYIYIYRGVYKITSPYRPYGRPVIPIGLWYRRSSPVLANTCRYEAKQSKMAPPMTEGGDKPVKKKERPETSRHLR